MYPSYFPFLILATLGSVFAESEVSSTPTSTTSLQPPQPVYKPPEHTPGYIPHQIYPYSDTYGGSLYDILFYPPSVPVKPTPYSEQPAQSNYMSAVIPAAQGVLQFTLRVLAKFGLFLVGGIALLIVGGIFTTAVCSLTPICVISFPMFGGIDKESVRSLMTPDKISAAAAMVQDAIGKYQRLQRAVGQ